MKLVSWNVNGIRSVIKKGFHDYLAEENPDVICLQEIKANPTVEIDLEGYHKYWYLAEKNGYSGTAIYSKKKALSVVYGVGVEEHDHEGRVITLEFPAFYLTTVYTPNAKRDLERLDNRQEWDRVFLAYMKELEQTKPVIFCGDLNVAHNEIDLANPKTNHRNAGFTDEERRGFDHIVNAGFIDTFRVFNQEPGQYTWWSFITHARQRNIGWRIDYFCISESLKKKLKEAFIRMDVFGSDHCPVGIVLK